MTHRKRQALRNLAERPGTEAEGEVARAMLAKLDKAPTTEEEYIDRFRDFLKTGSMDDLADAVGPRTCDCGTKYQTFSTCTNHALHERMRAQAPVLFPKGTRIYYNCWAYPANDPGTVVGYCKKPDMWGWIRVKFDRLKNPLAVPIWHDGALRISTEPRDRETRVRLNLRGGMDGSPWSGR